MLFNSARSSVPELLNMRYLRPCSRRALFSPALSHPQEIPRKFQLDVHENDVVHRVEVAPSQYLLEARPEAVARGFGIHDRDVIHEPPVAGEDEDERSSNDPRLQNKTEGGSIR